MIVEVSRGYIRLLVDGRAATLYGEALLPEPGSPDFIAYIENASWDDGGPMTPADLDRLRTVLLASAADRGLSIDLDLDLD